MLQTLAEDELNPWLRLTKTVLSTSDSSSGGKGGGGGGGYQDEKEGGCNTWDWDEGYGFFVPA